MGCACIRPYGQNNIIYKGDKDIIESKYESGNFIEWTRKDALPVPPGYGCDFSNAHSRPPELTKAQEIALVPFVFAPCGYRIMVFDRISNHLFDYLVTAFFVLFISSISKKRGASGALAFLISFRILWRRVFRLSIELLLVIS